MTLKVARGRSNCAKRDSTHTPTSVLIPNCYERPMTRHRRTKATTLTNRLWKAAELGEVRVGTGTVALAKTLDAEWSQRRRESDNHLAWQWTRIVSDAREAFVVIANGKPIAIWASKLGSPIDLGAERFYRLDYLEIDPNCRGDGQTSVLLFGLIAKRAEEHAAGGIILTAFPIDKLVEAYESLGAERGAPRGWHYPKELVPLTFRRSALTRLRRLIDGLEEDAPGSLS